MNLSKTTQAAAPPPLFSACSVWALWPVSCATCPWAEQLSTFCLRSFRMLRRVALPITAAAAVLVVAAIIALLTPAARAPRVDVIGALRAE